MSKKPKAGGGKKGDKLALTDMPPYVNENKAEENELKYQSNITYISGQNQILDNCLKELKEKESELIKCRSIYEKKLNEMTSNNMRIEGELAQIKRDNQNFENKLKAEADEKVAGITENFNKKLAQIQEELETYKEKNNKNKQKKKGLKEDMEKMKIEKERINNALFSTVKNHENETNNIKEHYESQISLLKAREEEYMRTNLSILESDIYKVYNDIKEKFEDKLKECMGLKSMNEKINDENKIIKMSLETNESIFKEISKMQYGQTKLIKQYKESLEQANQTVLNLKEENKRALNELSEKTTNDLEEKDQEITRLRHMLKLKNDENIQLRSLSQMILDQRSDIEQYFIECLEDVKVEIYKKKKELDRKKYFFPSIEKKYEERIMNNKKIDIKELTPEDKEKVLRLLFAKINENYKPKSYKDVNIHDMS